ncbi:hypothetical protein EIP91_003415 [Steccherinum ochraceum]|uniref:MARVEL domain-containing protein n=1 Tax=Steccherinum ochraceum TaxID=92696 RepID=A0A4V2MW54_9APHY|nr:hypothetical protein EIP91_003415 [Steccherinum ochraceum]
MAGIRLCSCIPNYCVVLLFSLLSTLCCCVLAVVDWVVVYGIDHGAYAGDDGSKKLKNLKIWCAISGALFTIVAVLSLLGVVGIALRNRRLVITYLSLNVVNSTLTTLAAGWTYLVLINPTTQPTDSVMSNATKVAWIAAATATCLFELFVGLAETLPLTAGVHIRYRARRVWLDPSTQQSA